MTARPALSPAPADFAHLPPDRSEAARSALRNNVLVFYGEGALMGGAIDALGLMTLLPMLVHELVERAPRLSPYENLFGASLVAAFYGMSHFTGFFGAGCFTHRRRRKAGFLFGVILGRCAFLLLPLGGILAVRLGWGTYLVMIFAALVLFAMVDGVIRPQWLDFFGRHIPARMRGRLFGVRGITAALIGLALVSSFPALGARIPFPYDYAVLHAAVAVLAFASFACLARLREVPYGTDEIEARPGLGRHLADSLAVLRCDRAYRRLLGVVVLLGAAALAEAALITLKAVTVLDLDEAGRRAFLGLAAPAAVVGRAIGMPTFGLVADRWGYRTLAATSFLTLLAALIVALLARSTLLFVAAIFLASCSRAGSIFFFLTAPLEWSPENRRPTYNGLMLLATLPLIAAPPVGGWLADRYGQDAVFLAGAGIIVLGLVLLATLVSNPRRRAA